MNFIEHSPWKDDTHSAGQEMNCLLCNPTVQ